MIWSKYYVRCVLRVLNSSHSCVIDRFSCGVKTCLCLCVTLCTVILLHKFSYIVVTLSKHDKTLAWTWNGHYAWNCILKPKPRIPLVSAGYSRNLVVCGLSTCVAVCLRLLLSHDSNHMSFRQSCCY